MIAVGRDRGKRVRKKRERATAVLGSRRWWAILSIGLVYEPWFRTTLFCSNTEQHKETRARKVPSGEKMRDLEYDYNRVVGACLQTPQSTESWIGTE